VIKKVEVLANLAVIITSVLLCTVLVKRYLLPPTNQAVVAANTAPISAVGSSSRKPSIAPGTKISLPGIDWSKTDRTLVLALSTTCHFCTESAPFYQKLQQQKRDDVRLVAFFPQPLQESRNYLDKLGVTVDEVAQGALSSAGVSGTPTLLLIDNQGVVIDSWVGKLSDGAAEEVSATVGK
jgi:thiol-disulfide isomerase/thioredoxin